MTPSEHIRQCGGHVRDDKTRIILSSQVNGFLGGIKYTPRLSQLPDAVREFKKLRVLTIAYQDIKALPWWCTELEHLEEIHILHCKLYVLPGDIGKLKKLRKIDVSGNKLTTLPEDIKNLVNLEELTIDGNNIKILPWCLTQLTKIKNIRHLINTYPIEHQDDLNHRTMLPMVECLHNGDLNGVKFARKNKTAWPQGSMNVVAGKGYLHLLTYCHDDMCPWENDTMKVAAENGHLHIIEYAIKNNCGWHPETVVGASRASNGYDIVKFCMENGCSWVPEATLIAAQNGNENILKYTLLHKLPWHKDTIPEIVRCDKLDLFKFAYSTGKLSPNNYSEKATGNIKEYIGWFISQNYPQDSFNNMKLEHVTLRGDVRNCTINHSNVLHTT